MFERIAVVGTGVIGTITASALTEAGRDVTAISQFRRENCKLLREEGVTVILNDIEHKVRLNARFIDDLVSGEDCFDLLLVTGKCNDAVDAVSRMLPFLTPDAVIVPFQNGLIEEYLIPEFGAERIIPCVCRTGGQMPLPRYVVTHDGFFDIGELNGTHTERLDALAAVLSDVKSVALTDNIIRKRWEKLSSCGVTVPTATISGYELFANTDEPTVYMVYARLAYEIYNTAKACGYELQQIDGLDILDWKKLTTDSDHDAYRRFADRPGGPPKKKEPEPPDDGRPKLSTIDAYSQDIERGVPLEIDFINGLVIKKAKEHGIAVPTHRAIVDMVYEIRDGKRTRNANNLVELLKNTDSYYQV